MTASSGCSCPLLVLIRRVAILGTWGVRWSLTWAWTSALIVVTLVDSRFDSWLSGPEMRLAIFTLFISLVRGTVMVRIAL